MSQFDEIYWILTIHSTYHFYQECIKSDQGALRYGLAWTDLLRDGWKQRRMHGKSASKS